MRQYVCSQHNWSLSIALCNNSNDVIFVKILNCMYKLGGSVHATIPQRLVLLCVIKIELAEEKELILNSLIGVLYQWHTLNFYYVSMC